MKTTNTYTLSSDLYKILFEAGLLPAQCTDFVIEAPLGGVVKIHCGFYPGDTLPKVMDAFAQSAQVVESTPATEVTDMGDDAHRFIDILPHTRSTSGTL